MPDSVVEFPLRGAGPKSLGLALTHCHAQYNLSFGDAYFLETFVLEADRAGVRRPMRERIRNVVAQGLAEGIYLPTEESIATFESETLSEVVESQVMTARRGAKLASAVLIHSACEIFFWRLVRIGLACNREQAVHFVAKKSIEVAKLNELGAEGALDAKIEQWWHELERESLLTKWDRLIAIVGFPKSLVYEQWTFTRETLEEFDRVRHNAVHHQGDQLAAFDLEAFTGQLCRAMLGLTIHIAIVFKLKVDPDALLGKKDRRESSRLPILNGGNVGGP